MFFPAERGEKPEEEPPAPADSPDGEEGKEPCGVGAARIDACIGDVGATPAPPPPLPRAASIVASGSRSFADHGETLSNGDQNPEPGPG
jgi:hypothetical protein